MVYITTSKIADQGEYRNQWGWVRGLRNILAFPGTKNREAQDHRKARNKFWASNNIRWISTDKRK